MIRRLGLVAILAVPGVASAQGRLVQDSIRALQERGKLPQTPTNDPLQPTGFSPPQGETKQEYLPSKDPNRLEFKLIRAGQISRTKDNIELKSGVEFEYKGYRIFADEASGNLDSSIFRMTGNVRMVGKESTVTGRSITANLNENTYVGEDVNAELKPSMLKGQLKSSLFTRSKESFGTTTEVESLFGGLTTCDLPHPHYEIVGKNTTVVPGRYAIFRDATFELFGRRTLRIPYLLIPLDDKSSKYTPEIGQSPDEGFYIKNRLAIPVRGMYNTLISRLDYMTKLGLGLGGDYGYYAKTLSGQLRVYRIFGQAKTLTINNSHRQEFRWGSVQIDNDYQKDNYLSAPGSTVLSTRANVVIPGRMGDSTRFSFTRNGSSSSGFGSTNQVFSLNDTRKLSSKLRTIVDINYSTNSTQSVGNPTAQRQQIDVRVRAENDLSKGMASLEYQRTIPIGTIPNFFSGADRTPLFTLSSDATKLMGQKFAKNMSFQTDLSAGEFNDPTRRTHLSRYFYNFAFQRTNRGKGKLRWDLNGRFRQGIYSDNTAQFVTEYGTTLSYGLGRDTAATFRYNMIKPVGFSPLQIDRTGRTSLSTLDLNFRPTPRTLLALQTGYDFQAKLTNQGTSWQQVALRGEYQIGDKFMFRSQAGYDTIRKVWNNVRLDLTVKSKQTVFGAGARFDGARHTWTNANLFLDNLQIGKTKISAVWNYNGFTKQFDTQQYSFIYDLHCAEAVLTLVENKAGFRAGREINFFIRLKALPFDTPFGVGRRGQPVNYNLGSG